MLARQKVTGFGLQRCNSLIYYVFPLKSIWPNATCTRASKQSTTQTDICKLAARSATTWDTRQNRTMMQDVDGHASNHTMATPHHGCFLERKTGRSKRRSSKEHTYTHARTVRMHHRGDTARLGRSMHVELHSVVAIRVFIVLFIVFLQFFDCFFYCCFIVFVLFLYCFLFLCCFLLFAYLLLFFTVC